MRDKTLHAKRKIGKAGVLSLALLAVAALVQLVASNALAGKGGELGELEKAASRLVKENQLLKSDVSQKASLSNIAAQSAELGLTYPESIIYADLSQPVAALPQ